MSCCTIKQETISNAEEIKLLKKHFDEVLLEEKSDYNLLTLRDRTNKTNYDYVVWLCVKIKKGYKNEYHSSKTDEEMISKVCNSILDWVEILKNFERKKTLTQLSLFGEDEKDELEQEPNMPTSDGNWSKYFKECAKVRKNNAMKQHSFFGLLNINYYTYTDIDWREHLPSIEEIREMYKKVILTRIYDSYDENNISWFSFDIPDYLYRDGGLSNYELIARLNQCIRLYLLPYKRYATTSPDDSYTIHEISECIGYRFYLDGSRVSGNSNLDKDKTDLPSYDGVFDIEFISWVRNIFKIDHKEVISDEDILKENLKQFFSSILWYVKDEYNFENRISIFENWKQFKNDIQSFCKKRGVDITNGGGSGHSIDGFSGWFDKSKKGSIRIEQNIDIRRSIGRDVDDSKIDTQYNKYVVWKLTGDEIYKKAFELLREKEKTLFDCLAA